MISTSSLARRCAAGLALGALACVADPGPFSYTPPPEAPASAPKS